MNSNSQQNFFCEATDMCYPKKTSKVAKISYENDTKEKEFDESKFFKSFNKRNKQVSVKKETIFQNYNEKSFEQIANEINNNCPNDINNNNMINNNNNLNINDNLQRNITTNHLYRRDQLQETREKIEKKKIDPFQMDLSSMTNNHDNTIFEMKNSLKKKKELSNDNKTTSQSSMKLSLNSITDLNQTIKKDEEGILYNTLQRSQSPRYQKIQTNPNSYANNQTTSTKLQKEKVYHSTDNDFNFQINHTKVKLNESYHQSDYEEPMIVKPHILKRYNVSIETPNKTSKIWTYTEENEQIKESLQELYPNEKLNDVTTPENTTSLTKKISYRNHYGIMIASKYFHSIDDFINLEKAVKAYQGNMERFRFNPIPLTKTTRKFFPCLQTLHIYDEDDERFENDKEIEQIVVWYQVNYSQTFNSSRKAKYKNVILTESDILDSVVSLPDVQILDKRCLSRYTDLVEINIHSNIKFIAHDTFEECIKLTRMNFVPFWYRNADRMFANFSGLVSFQIPFTVKYINDEEITLDPLTSITIPTNISRLKKYCFHGASHLVEIKLHDDINEIGESCFQKCQSLTSITLPSNLTLLSDAAFEYCKKLSYISIPSKITSLPRYCFQNADLKTVILHSNIIKIGDYCFQNCVKLKEIELPKNLEYIGDSAFEKCQLLESAMIPEKVISIGSCAFNNCISLTCLTIPSNVTSIGMQAFGHLADLKTVTIPSLSYSLPHRCFWNCSNLVEVKITRKYWNDLVGNECFKGCPCEATLKANGMKESALIDSTLDKEEIFSILKQERFYRDQDKPEKKRKLTKEEKKVEKMKKKEEKQKKKEQKEMEKKNKKGKK